MADARLMPQPYTKRATCHPSGAVHMIEEVNPKHDGVNDDRNRPTMETIALSDDFVNQLLWAGRFHLKQFQ